ncbi:4Fe-4S ferredoxin iron-sulfur binding domain protein [Rippkaea orientalis PCC 8801]|uniref:4Fe-4S ferredoxin iron-sulfur binding domain protein n=1 Tax=Rippkaea orientalis (strain PCC 8801 / RF-1) TaxID=41431 RepID=B7K2D3_RIPO1|nr:LdpA C-terminal domain-containing domain [Rippkaea orientalis]ACK65269.1 4Fe-4S ferredoxin iron-sulfur binding domain protein [Rippkaea orientalis PCC 8801]
MNTVSDPLQSLKAGHWFKLICGASFQDLPAIRSLTLAYTVAGADCIDVAADPSVIAAAQEGIKAAQKWLNFSDNQGLSRKRNPWLMVSLNDGEDPHFRKAYFDPQRCPPDCPRPCEKICPAQAIIESEKGIFGVIDRRCYGCGRCLPLCPHQLIETRSHLVPPRDILPLIEPMGIDAMEIHTQVGREEQFRLLWEAIAPTVSQLKLLAISCPDSPQLIEYLRYLYDLISPLPCPLIWQTDGRPMSGDIGKGTTHPTIKLAQKVLNSRIPGFVQLAGGTNHHTVPKLQEIGLLKTASSSSGVVAGVAYGSYGRSILSPILEQLENQSMSLNQPLILENYPDLLKEALKIADSLVSPLKGNRECLIS